jgi:hypothetical protein
MEFQMNQLVLKEMNDQRLIYLYYPEGEDAFGEIEYLFSEQRARIAKKAANDESGYLRTKQYVRWKNSS